MDILLLGLVIAICVLAVIYTLIAIKEAETNRIFIEEYSRTAKMMEAARKHNIRRGK